MKKPIQEIFDSFYRISLPLSFRLKQVNVFAAFQEKGITLFDTGPDLPATSAVLNESLRKIGGSIEKIERIFITHSHVDHCGFAGRIQERSGARIFISEIEFGILNQMLQNTRRMALIRTFCHQHGLDEDTIQAYSRFTDAFRAVIHPFTPDRFLADDETVTIGNRIIRVLFTPGHTRGHICFFLPEENTLLAGDNILPHITPNLSPDLFCPSFRPLQSYIRSLERIEDLQVTSVYPAHGISFEDLKGRVEEIKAHHCRRKELALKALGRHPKTAGEISNDIFGVHLPAFDRLLALNETYVHLQELEKDSFVTKQKRDDLFLFHSRQEEQ